MVSWQACIWHCEWPHRFHAFIALSEHLIGWLDGLFGAPLILRIFPRHEAKF